MVETEGYMVGGGLSGRTVIVTGGGRGLGRAMAFGLAKEGANVCVAAHIKEDIEAVTNEASELGISDRFTAILGDLRKTSVCQKVVEIAISKFGGIFGLINNAGLTFTYIAPNRYAVGGKWEKFYELSDEIVQNVMDTNFIAADRMARLVTPHLVRAGEGRLINVTTRLSTMTHHGASPYGPSKAALEIASEIWVKDLEGTGVTVNIVNPGAAANTDGFEVADNRERASDIAGGMIEPYKMVAPACWLFSEAASNVTGMRFDAIDWDENGKPQLEANKVGRPFGFTNKPIESVT
ncbi:MAG: SDR family oxidoreductase [Pseudomonadota bacterium]|nr:SDR family oxidoreductase [Pseudomonadota bacterium]